MTILSTDDLKNILKLSDKQAKALMRTEGFPSIQIGREYRVTQDALAKWLDDTREIRLDYSKC